MGHDIYVPRFRESFQAFTPGGSPTDYHLLAMDLVDGLSAGRVKRELQSIPEELGKGIFGDVTRAICWLHGLGIVHRDVKSDNIMLSRQGQSHLCDFGSAMALEDVPHNQHELAGTTVYMAPELGGSRWDQRVDLWALGVTALELIAGDLPMQNACKDASDRETLQQVLKGLKTPVLPEDGRVSTAFCWFVRRCSSRSPGRRWSASVLLEQDAWIRSGSAGHSRQELSRLVDRLMEARQQD